MTTQQQQLDQLLMAAADFATHWKEERHKFLQYATPFWLKNGGEALLAHMRDEYVMVDENIVSRLYKLDAENREILLAYLRWR